MEEIRFDQKPPLISSPNCDEFEIAVSAMLRDFKTLFLIRMPPWMLLIILFRVMLITPPV